MAATLAIRNARLWTAVPGRPWARSLVIRDGVIDVIDDESAVGRADRVIDAGGRTITSGLIDTHTHFIMGGESLGHLDLSRIRSRAEFEAAIASRHGEMTEEERRPDMRSMHAAPGTRWLRAFGWSQENWGGEMPDKSWLSAAGTRPVVAYRMDSHVCLVNDAVLEQCDLDRPIDGGRVERGSRGEPTGLMVEAAAWSIVNPIMPPSTLEAKRAALRRAQKHALSLGLTTIGSMEYERDVRDVYEPIRDELSVRMRLTLLDRTPPIDFSFAESFENDDRLAVIGFKSFIDGTLGSRTARMLDDYADEPGNRGMWCELAASGGLDAWIAEVARRGFQPSMHAIGDAAARLALGAIDSLTHAHDGGRGNASPMDRRGVASRPRIEHAQTLHPDDIPRFRRVIASMQPYHRADDGVYARRRLGDARMPGFFAFRSLKRAGAILAFGSDWPIVSLDPLLGIRAAVTGLLSDGRVLMSEETIPIEETFRGYTIDAAHALGFDDQVGSIAVGKRADLTVFNRDPLAADWSVDTPRIEATLSGGVVRFDSLNA
jgi:predicted amidohydrolase YtcJ